MITDKPDTLLQKAFIESTINKLPPHKAVSIDGSVSCEKAIELMISEKIGCLLIRHQQEPISGIVTERDILMKLVTDKRSLSAVPVTDIMTSNPEVLKAHASIAKAIYLMAIGGFRHIPVMLRDGTLSVISATDFTRFIFEKVSLRTLRREEALEVIPCDNTVDCFFDGDLSALAPSKALHVSPETRTSQVIEAMIKSRTGAAVIGDPDRKTVSGLFTERDLIKRYMLNRDTLSEAPVQVLMTPNPVTLQTSTSVLYALDAMTEGKFRHIPIVGLDEKLVGILSIKNFMKFVSQGIVSELTKAKTQA